MIEATLFTLALILSIVILIANIYIAQTKVSLQRTAQHIETSRTQLRTFRNEYLPTLKTHR